MIAATLATASGAGGHAKNAPTGLLRLKGPNSPIASLHAAFERETGHKLKLDGIYHREQAWLLWRKQGFTEADLVLVVRYLRAQIKKDLRRPESLKFSNLIESWDRFEEDLNMARDWARNHRPPPSNKAIVLREAGRSEPETQGEVRVAGNVAQEILDGYEQMRKAIE